MKVVITERLMRAIELPDTLTDEEAIARVEAEYHDGMHVLEWSDYEDTLFEVERDTK